MKHSLKITALAATIMLISSVQAAGAQNLSQEELTRLVQAQTAKIEALEARLSELEGRQAVPAPVAAAPAVTVAAASRGVSGGAIDWSKGMPEFVSDDGQSSFHVRGRALTDISSTGGSDYSDRNLSGTEVRSVRIGIEGRHGRFRYEIEGESADNKTSWKSAYVGVAHQLFGRNAEFLAGNQLNDRSIDGSSANPTVPFHDLNVVAGTVVPQHGSYGVSLTEKIYGQNWHIGVAATGDDIGNTGDNNDTLTYMVRGHWNPLKQNSATLHLGAWGFYESLPSGTTTGVLKQPQIGGHFNDRVLVVPGQVIDVDRSHAYGVELGGFFDRGWIYGEWGRRNLHDSAAVGNGDYHHDAYSIGAGWFLTGARPGYSARTGSWGKTRVEHPVFSGGAGAWELKARYENVNFTDLPGGGKGSSYTAGVNWYLNDLMRIMLDVVWWETNNRSGTYIGKDDGYTVNTRFQINF
ncbi:MAG: porin [Xanthomonadaceae bacterium]|jgi:phosphate-selective porin OprO/OprP|nr:porin [Xanthomonadaceae bacterium]